MSIPTPAQELANSHLNAVARKIWAEALAQPEFANVGVIWGYSASSQSDHRNGRCCDFMITYTKTSLTQAQRIELGNRMRAYFVKHADRLHVQGIIWNRKVTGYPIGNGKSSPDVTYRGPAGVARPYSGGDAHTDHVHVQVSGAPVKSWLAAPEVFNPLRDYHVDPAKVSTSMAGLDRAGGSDAVVKTDRKPGHWLRIQKIVTAADGRKWAVTEFKTYYLLDLLAEGKTPTAQISGEK